MGLLLEGSETGRYEPLKEVGEESLLVGLEGLGQGSEEGLHERSPAQLARLHVNHPTSGDCRRRRKVEIGHLGKSVSA